jgi:O-antigen/teichoic acid export membrane protein
MDYVIVMVTAYLLWYILSKITTPEVIGISSSLNSLSLILMTVASLGIPIGSQRFLGRFFEEERVDDVKVTVEASLIIVSLGLLVLSVFILVTRDWLFQPSNISLICMLIFLMCASTFNLLFRNIIISSLDTKKLLTVSIISSAVKLAMVIILVLVEKSELGVITGFAVAQLLSAVLLAYSILSFFNHRNNKRSVQLIQSFKMLFSSSVISWIPSVIDSVGTQLGVIVLLATQGATQAGSYFLAFQINMGLFIIIWAFYSVVFPALSAMNEGRRQFLSRTIKISLIIIMPVSSALIFSSREVMQLFGASYIEGASSLQILLISLFPLTITVAIAFLLHAKGRYKEVLMIGLAASMPRIVMYFLFTTWFSGAGAALSYTTGSIAGCIMSLILAKRNGLTLFWKELILIFVVPMFTSFILVNLKLHFVPYVLLATFVTYVLLLKCNIIIRRDVEDCLAVFPSGIANPIISTVNKIGTKLSKNY